MTVSPAALKTEATIASASSPSKGVAVPQPGMTWASSGLLSRPGAHAANSPAAVVYIDLTCVMAARERQRDKQFGIATRRLSWPTAVLAGGVAQPDRQPHPGQQTIWGQVVAAAPPDAFLATVSIIECRAAPARAGTAVPGPERRGRGTSHAGTPRTAEHQDQDQHGQPITRGALRAHLGVSSQAACDLLRQVRRRGS